MGSTMTGRLSCAAASDTGKPMNSTVDKINRTIYKEYPFYKGVKPKVTENSQGGLLLIYEKNEITADGLSLPMLLRVKADAQGEIRSVSGSK